MENQHLTYFKVENFKRFSSLELNDIGQFNIIVGDNNTGKTSLLEALLVDIGSFSAIAKRLEQRVPIYKNRSQFSFVELLEYFVTKEKTTSLLEINWKHSDIAFKLQKESNIFNLTGKFEILNDTSKDRYIPFVEFGNFYDEHFENKYSQFIQISKIKKNRLTQDLKALVPNIEYIDLSSNNGNLDLLIAETTSDVTASIGKYGEGTLKLARILVDLQVYSGKRLMIDEVEAGIHWSRYKVFWKTILRAALEADTQLFMTTHDSECLKYLIQVVEEEPELASVKEKLRLIELRERTTDREIAPIVRNFDSFEYYINEGHEVRGGRLVR